jgi:citrate lyase beta subunit
MGLPEARRHRREFLKEHRWNNLVRINCMRHPYFNC